MLNDVEFSILDQISTKQSRDEYQGPGQRQKKTVKGGNKKQKNTAIEDDTESY
jgi:hypothetical protein